MVWCDHQSSSLWLGHAGLIISILLFIPYFLKETQIGHSSGTEIIQRRDEVEERLFLIYPDIIYSIYL